MRIGIYTLGCKVNQAESAAIAAIMTERGHEIVPFSGEAEVYVVNTCAVTGESARKARQVIRQSKRRGRVAVCGCYSQLEADAVRALGADLVGGTGDRRGFALKLEEMGDMEIDNPFQRKGFERLPVSGGEERTRAFLKVEDGCHNFCTYCIIPFARGAVRSMPADEAAQAAQELAEKGYREVVLTGIELSSWGRDLPYRPPLETLIGEICRAVPQVRIRLGSLEPRTIMEVFCQTISSLHNLCPHFHLSLQSGCDKTLAAMGRKYDTARFGESVSLLRQYWREPAITTDLITGFPGETEEDFGKTMDFIRQCNFSAMHVFPYSRRAGTPAENMPGQVPEADKHSRAARARALAGDMEKAYLAAQVGRRVEVLFEQPRKGSWEGHTPNYLKVQIEEEVQRNSLHLVDIIGVKGDTLVGRLATEGEDAHV